MVAKIELTLEEYYDKVQEMADQIAKERNEPKIEVIRYPEAELRKRIIGCARNSPKLGLLILEEAKRKVDEKYA